MSSTQVILLERVEKLGVMGDVVNVKPGFARNYLLPQKKALRASKSNLAYFEAQKKSLEADSTKKQKEAETLAKKIEGVKAPLIRQASESGQLFGSVTARDIATAVSEASKETITKNMVRLNQNIKMIGLIPVEVVLHPDVSVDVIVNIARSPEEADIQNRTGRALIADANTYEEEPAEEATEEVFEDTVEADADVDASSEEAAEE
ncbi:MAG: 50S ribosomal protein L9 [Alphaproteobacteria bacterium]|nr:MAG: 50S ribosomal protein L9 [Alphaproteobacteria bacterium]